MDRRVGTLTRLVCPERLGRASSTRSNFTVAELVVDDPVNLVRQIARLTMPYVAA